MKDPDKFVCNAAAYSLCRIDESSKATAIKVLHELRQDKNQSIAGEARTLLLEIDPSEVPVPEIGFLR